MTPAEISLKLEGERDRLKESRDITIIGAYINDWLRRKKRMPSLKKILKGEAEKPDVNEARKWYEQEMKKLGS